MIWIRTQDKGALVPIDKLIITYKQSRGTVWYNIIAYDINNELNYINLGLYDTETKAMKVLDMIHETIFHSNNSWGDVGYNSNLVGEITTQSHMVFDMPCSKEVTK